MRNKLTAGFAAVLPVLGADELLPDGVVLPDGLLDEVLLPVVPGAHAASPKVTADAPRPTSSRRRLRYLGSGMRSVPFDSDMLSLSLAVKDL